MKHLKTTLLALALLFSVNSLMAQEKYDYATLFFTTQGTIAVSINGEQFELIKFSKKELQHSGYDLNPALKHVNKMNDEGWELMSVSCNMGCLFTLQRKEQ